MTTHALIAALASGDYAPQRGAHIDAAVSGGGGAVVAPTSAPAAPPPVAPTAAPVDAPKSSPTPAEAAPAATTPAPAKVDPIAVNLARLSAGEKRLQAERAAITKERTELATREKALADGGAQAKAGLEALRARAAKGEFDEVAKELGFDYGSWTKAKLSNKASAKPAAEPAPSPLSASEIAALVQKGVDEQLAKREADAKRTQEESASTAWQNAVKNFEGTVERGGVAKYEMLTAELSEYPQRIHDALRELAARSPELTFDDAADKLEAYFVDKASKRASSPKVRALLEASKQAETPTPRAQPGPATADVPRTLTNSLAAEGASTKGDPTDSKPLSRPAQIRAAREKEREEERRVDALSRR